jgi:predicted transcriptional regulator
MSAGHHQEHYSQSELCDWQIAEIKKGIAEADRGEIALEADVEATIRRWTG